MTAPLTVAERRTDSHASWLLAVAILRKRLMKFRAPAQPSSESLARRARLVRVVLPDSLAGLAFRPGRRSLFFDWR